MKKLISLVAVVAVAVTAGAALARQPKQVSDAQVQEIIDARLHEMLVKLNSQHR